MLFGGLTGLVALDLSYCLRVAPEALEALRPITGLRELRLQNSGVMSNHGMAALRPMQCLEVLSWRQRDNAAMGGNNADMLHMAGLQDLAPLSGSLTDLDLASCTFPDESYIQRMYPLQQLRRLVLSECLSTEMFHCLANFPDLRHLDVSRSKGILLPSHLEPLADLSHLVQLDLAMITLSTDRIVEETLASFSALTQLNLTGTTLLTDAVRTLRRKLWGLKVMLHESQEESDASSPGVAPFPQGWVFRQELLDFSEGHQL